jgi:hypothetical protein
VGHAPGLPRGPHSLHLADPALLGPAGNLRLLQRSRGSPRGGGALRCGRARLSHRGEDCSFETFLKEYDLDDLVLREIAEIVHDADLLDEKYARPESEGLDAIVRGMQLSLPDDQTLTGHTNVLYDGLFAYLSREVL